MKRLVVDASVVAKLFFDEEHSDQAQQCVERAEELLAPDLVWAEVANVIWKRARRGDISPDTALEVIKQALTLPIQVTPAADLMPDALELAIRFDRSVYDCLYLTLAVKTGTVMATGDKRLANALADGPLAGNVEWIGA